MLVATCCHWDDVVCGEVGGWVGVSPPSGAPVPVLVPVCPDCCCPAFPFGVADWSFGSFACCVFGAACPFLAARYPVDEASAWFVG